MKRFWTKVALREVAAGWGIALDDRLLKTPARETLVVGAHPLAEAIADEWRACGEEIDPRSMPLTGLANAAIDHVAPAPERFADDLAQYAEGDLLCYRAEHPPKLVAAQAAAWNPLLDWARQRFDTEFVVTAGIVHVEQPQPTVARLAAALASMTPFELAALSPIVTIGGSLVAALALCERAIDLDTAWNAVTIDDRWQIEQWGADDEAVASLAYRRQEFDAAARFLSLLH
ncbi:MAG: ATPase [Pseudomonadota bacterium]|nr:ATPase [Pseudomonadota bacterium]